VNSELTLLKFINHYIIHDGDEKYSNERTNLIQTFSYSIVEKIHPKVFAENITEIKIKLKSRDKENGNFVKISLSHLEKLHFKLIYNLCYIDHCFPDKISHYNFSEDLAELYGSEEKLISLYEEIKQIGLN
tara:strand:+ start:377 stop:769 length:393 start_codon:yes stop_codon:yes gene_type:complete